jgi:hypothetical protein
MRDLEATLQEFGEFLLKSKLAREKNAPYIVRWVRRFLSAPASEPPNGSNWLPRTSMPVLFATT